MKFKTFSILLIVILTRFQQSVFAEPLILPIAPSGHQTDSGLVLSALSTPRIGTGRHRAEFSKSGKAPGPKDGFLFYVWSPILGEKYEVSVLYCYLCKQFCPLKQQYPGIFPMMKCGGEDANTSGNTSLFGFRPPPAEDLEGILLRAFQGVRFEYFQENNKDFIFTLGLVTAY